MIGRLIARLCRALSARTAPRRPAEDLGWTEGFLTFALARGLVLRGASSVRISTAGRRVLKQAMARERYRGKVLF